MSYRETLPLDPGIAIDSDDGTLLGARDSRSAAFERLVEYRGAAMLRDNREIELVRFSDAEIIQESTNRFEDRGAHVKLNLC
jgi:hypothetical protein